MAAVHCIAIITSILIGIAICSIASDGTLKTTYSGTPWPMPSDISLDERSLALDPNVLRITTSSYCRLISAAIYRYTDIIKNEERRRENNERMNNDQVDQFTTLTLTIDNESDCDRYPYLGMNESYRLEINEMGRGVLQAPTVWGILRGLETFSQLIFPVSDDRDTSNLRIRLAVINDQPRFSHRGVLLDTSRHYLSKNILKKNLDLMAFAKFNVFHWHMVDDPSFPYVSNLYPSLSSKGAYSRKHVYTPRDIEELVEYARLRGIRVIPEFDTPSHMLSWGRGMPDLLTKCGRGDYGVVDPSNSANLDFLLHFFNELSHRFPDQYTHLGGDEVDFTCWKTSERVRQMMKRLNITNERKLEDYYMQKLVNLTKTAKKNTTGYLVWQEIFDNGVRLGPEAIVQVWKGSYKIFWDFELFKITYYGLRAILSSCWYLNDIVYGQNWQGYYRCDPHSYILSARQKALVIGGEACMWGEFVDATNLLPTLWPRASAVAERLWSPATVKDPELARPRLEEHRCRLIRRGYPASPVTGPGFCTEEWDG